MGWDRPAGSPPPAPPQWGKAVFWTGLVACLGAWWLISSSKQNAERRVEYRLAGTITDARVQYDTPNGTVSETVRLPWTRAAVFRGRPVVSLAASDSDEVGSMACEIVVDGATWRRSSTDSSASGVHCHGLLDEP